MWRLEARSRVTAGPFSSSQDTPRLEVLRTGPASSPGRGSLLSCLDFHCPEASTELLHPLILALFYFLLSYIVIDISHQTLHTFLFLILKILG